MMISITPNHGYVGAVLIGTYLVHNMYMSFKVVQARKKYGVKYPALYAGENVEKIDAKAAKAFDCVQRGHQNSLESLSSFYALFLAAGLRYPISAAIVGAIYNIGRIMYFQGYSTGDPSGRYRGGFHHLAAFALAGLVGKWSFELLTASA